MADEEAEIFGSGAALAASPAWQQIVADVIGRPIVMSGAGEEASARGAAVYGLAAIGAIHGLDDLAPERGVQLVPDNIRRQIYRAGLARHRALEARLRS